MKIDWIMVMAVLAWTLYAVTVVTAGRTYLRRMRRARRQLDATRHVVAAPDPAPDRGDRFVWADDDVEITPAPVEAPTDHERDAA